MSKIRKCVIPVAGIGTRFLPATKAQPKEMLPVVDKPVVQYVVEEAVAAGITDIILVTGPSKRAVEDHFSPNYELVGWLKKQGKNKLVAEVKRIADLANFIFIRQKGPYGNGTPVWCAKDIVGNEPFAVLWGDEFFYSPHKPRLKQLLEVYQKYQSPVVTAYQVQDDDTNRYGILKTTPLGRGVHKVKDIIEKPGPLKAPSRLAILGGYILTPDIFSALARTKVGKDGELWLVDAIKKLLPRQTVYAREVTGKYFDTGSKLGWLKANLELAQVHPELKQPFKDYLKGLK
ncbi:TPA: UTP--glucose-1-phosphate uridylyltransferase [Patescibacteria group bacterium]|nr:UTP--glucose-1-phosphate uridylyltransferase [Patescibacteria group bacterium]HCU47762.1 UTP--glucose-1-phosphate uridylyltransferase [Patescibacteria group bacterium]